jgi:hypothetical protein
LLGLPRTASPVARSNTFMPGITPAPPAADQRFMALLPSVPLTNSTSPVTGSIPSALMSTSGLRFVIGGNGTDGNENKPAAKVPRNIVPAASVASW